MSAGRCGAGKCLFTKGRWIFTNVFSVCEVPRMRNLGEQSEPHTPCYTQANEVSIFWLCVQNVTILSLILTISYKSFIVDNGHTSEPSDCLILRQLPQANISPPLSTNVCICSVTLNLSVSRDSHSTPLPSKNTFISSPSFNAKFANRNAFQTVSESFE